MRELTRLMNPVRFFVAVEMTERYYRLSVFAADFVGYFPQPDVVADMVFKFPSSLNDTELIMM